MALFQILGVIPPWSLAQSLDAISVAALEYARKGVTTAQSGFTRTGRVLYHSGVVYSLNLPSDN